MVHQHGQAGQPFQGRAAEAGTPGGSKGRVHGRSPLFIHIGMQAQKDPPAPGRSRAEGYWAMLWAGVTTAG